MGKKSTFSFIMFCFVLVFFYVPLILLIGYSFNSGKTFSWEGFSLIWYEELFFRGTDVMWKSFWNSLIIGVSSSLIATFIGTLGAIGLYWYNFKMKRYLQIVTYLPLIIPEIIIGVSMIILFNGVSVTIPGDFMRDIHLNYSNYIINFRMENIAQVFYFKLSMPLSLFTVFLAHVTFCTPFVLFIIISRLEEFDYSIIEAAYDLGAKELEVLLKVIVPVTMPGIISGFLMAMTLSLDDFVITSFVSGPGATTLPLYISNTIKRGAAPVLNALSVMLIVMSLLLAFLSRNFQKYMFK